MVSWFTNWLQTVNYDIDNLLPMSSKL